MSVSKFILIATVTSLTLFSCEKEEITPVLPNSPAVDSEVPNTIDDNLAEREGINVVKFNEDAQATLTPCGNRFYADVRIGNSVVSGTYYYEIRKAGSNEIVDSGMIGHGGVTNPVLESCTEYVFKFFSANGTSHSVSQLLSSDGCGGVFSC